jgi:hypothetical protein
VGDLKQFQRCVLSERYQHLVDSLSRAANAMGFSTTPSSLVGRRPVIGYLGPESLDSLVATALRERRSIYR